MKYLIFKRALKGILLSLMILLSAVFCNLKAQSSGKIEVITEPSINNIVQMHVSHNRSTGKIKGFRIQIFYDSGNNSKASAYSALSRFSAKYPDVPAYLSYTEPNYKVRVGNFRTRLDAQRFFQYISTDFSMSYIVKDDIRFPPLDKNATEKVENEIIEEEDIK